VVSVAAVLVVQQEVVDLEMLELLELQTQAVAAVAEVTMRVQVAQAVLA
jgi:hypothetical protein